MRRRHQISAFRNALHDMRSDLKGIQLAEDLAAVDIELAVTNIANAISALTDVLEHRLGDD